MFNKVMRFDYEDNAVSVIKLRGSEWYEIAMWMEHKFTNYDFYATRSKRKARQVFRARRAWMKKKLGL